MHFEDKLLRLYKQFSFLPEAVIQHHLSAAQGHYDMAVALLDQMDDATHKEVQFPCQACLPSDAMALPVHISAQVSTHFVHSSISASMCLPTKQLLA